MAAFHINGWETTCTKAVNTVSESGSGSGFMHTVTCSSEEVVVLRHGRKRMCSFKWRGISYQAPPPLDNGLDDLHARNPHQIQQVYVVAAYRLTVRRLLL